MYPCIVAFEVDCRYCVVIEQGDIHGGMNQEPEKLTAGRTPAIPLDLLFLLGSVPEDKAPPVAGVHGAPWRPQLEGRPRRFHRQIHIGATRTC